MPSGRVRVVGVRHHSPACARLVAQVIAQERPQAVLIEGPSDFNPRLGELLLDHQLPLALYSYANEDGQAAQCWFPLLDHSPEWVALREGRAVGAALRFMDLPHWRYRALPDAQRRTAAQRNARPRYAQVVEHLCRRFGCDGDDALWDHLFESQPADAAPDELSRRLDLYFDELRGDEAGTPQDQAREAHMAQWIAWAASSFERVLVVCGGWHKPALEKLPFALSSSKGRHKRPVRTEPVEGLRASTPLLRHGPSTSSVPAQGERKGERAEEPDVPQPADERAAGCYLVPYEFRQVDALGGYAAGLPSPMYYQWLWQHGPRPAGDRAVAAMVSRLRRAQVPLSTADLLAFERSAAALAALRGHPVPLRTDLLDALQSAVVKEALEAPAPWSNDRRLGAQHHPVLREALLALTGDGAGRLHGDTPLPPLLHDVHQRLAALDLQIERTPQKLVLDRRRADDAPRAHLLWQLRCLQIGGVQLVETKAPRAARGLARELAFEEHWRLQQTERWHPDLIEAAVHGATLESAARQALLRRVADAHGDAAVLTQCLMQAIRAGLLDMGQELAQQLRHGIGASHDHGALARAAQSLAAIVEAGFWGDDPRDLLEDTLALMAGQLLWLLEGRDGAGSPQQLEADVRAAAVFDTLLRLHLPALDGGFVRQTMARLARSSSKPPALRGAALGVAFQHEALAGAAGDAQAARDEVIAITRAMPPRDALGDFLYGLFSCARALASEGDGIVRAIHAALDGMGVEDFLVALPALRAALGWFPPRERGALAAHVARLLGLDAGQRQRLLKLHDGTEALLDARRVEAQALAWAQQIGLLHDPQPTTPP
ncbi:DUF5682 family protein [Rhizobacter sp. SG703]|uniref:DUF5682 family protein n=1 Tax=Rhizobacter sp. SG703 TaxID=2587140 RepID=UPI001446C803|nr:DUF5682 family protein [Rhizobacter sp. SG703]NKI93979.1 hypothetical protein [Rhizobacter sp. SG703]